MTLGRYVLDERVAEGGMGIVFRGRVRGAHGFERKVAVKTIHPTLLTDEAVRLRFLEEARIASVIRQDNVAQVLDVCEEEGILFLALEWIEGVSLRELLQRADEARGSPECPDGRVPLDV